GEWNRRTGREHQGGGGSGTLTALGALTYGGSMRRFATLLLLLLLPAVWHPRHSHAQNLPSSEQVIRPGFGTLKQEDLQIALATSAIEIRFTPLDPRVINLLAPDAYQAMAVLVQNNRPRIDSAARANSVSRPGIAYVQFYGLQPGANFDAQSLV